MKSPRKDCHIYGMLRSQKGHLSFHTPGHKKGKWDITELRYSDNLRSPSGCILRAEEDIARIVGAKKSFLVTDGSTAGVLAMLHAAKSLGVKSLAASALSHESFFHGCALLGITPLLIAPTYVQGIPQPPTLQEWQEAAELADGVFLTSPDYYGNIPPLPALQAYCKERGKLFLIDGAHGGHLHFHKEIYAGGYADAWVDGVHKSLPALTQGSVLSAGTEEMATRLQESVCYFRTTSPSYPIMASIEYAVKYPQNARLERWAAEWIAGERRLYPSKDWTKICAKFGKNAFLAEKELEKRGIYAEFCDGNILHFYLSPAVKMRSARKLRRVLTKLFARYPYEENEEEEKRTLPHGNAREWMPLEESIGRICAEDCGLFPPCTPLLFKGEQITKEKLARLQQAANRYGVCEGKIRVFSEEEV